MAITFQSFKEDLAEGKYESLVNAQRALGRSALSPSLKGRACKLAEVHFSSVVEVAIPDLPIVVSRESKRRTSVKSELNGSPANGAGEGLQVTLLKMLADEAVSTPLMRLLKKCADEHVTLPDLLEQAKQLESVVRIIKGK